MRFRRCDPWRALREIHDDKHFNFDNVRDALEEDGEDRRKLLDAVCNAFGVRRFDEPSGEGLTESELLALFDDLIGYMVALKKNGPTYSTSAEAGATDGPSAGGSPSESLPNSPLQASPTFTATNSAEDQQPATPFATP